MLTIDRRPDRPAWLREARDDDIFPVAEAYVDLLAGRIDWDASTSPVL